MLLFEKVVSLKNVFIMVKNLGSLIGKSSLVALDASILSKKKNMNIRGGVYFWWRSRLEEIAIFWDFLMFYQIFLSQQVKLCVIIIYKHGIWELSHELPNDLRLRILEN